MEELRQLNLRLHGAKAAAEEQALTDTLTGLRNRRALDHALAQTIEREIPFGLMHIDLDFFKTVNDTLGHAAGDHVLRQVARVLVDETRTGDTVARVGGDEFTVLLPRQTDPARLLTIANRIIAKLKQPMDFEGNPCRISASIGMTISTLYPAPLPEQMISDADLALYAGKHAGRGVARLHGPETAPAIDPAKPLRAG
jgi:diguanylate cyclase (GGDEF)-like protein